MLKRLIRILVGIFVGVIVGFGVACFIMFITEAIMQPKYQDTMFGFWLLTLVVCVPLFAVVFGVLSHRLGSRILQTRRKHSVSGDACDDSKK